MEFVQVHVRTNLAPSVPYVDRSRAADGVIRLLRGAIAFFREAYKEAAGGFGTFFLASPMGNTTSYV